MNDRNDTKEIVGTIMIACVIVVAIFMGMVSFMTGASIFGSQTIHEAQQTRPRTP